MNLARAASFLVAAGLWAAAAAAQPKVDLDPKEGQGHLLFKVVSARQVSFLNPKWTTLVLQSKAIGRFEEIYNLAEPATAGSLFFARIPEGEYEFVELKSIGPGPGLLLALLASDNQSMRSRIGAITVRRGKLTNLGTLVVAAPSGKPPEIEHLSGPAGRQSVAEEFERRTGRRLEMETQETGKDADAQAEKQALAHARSMISLIGWGDDAGDGLLGGAALGQIAALGPDGAWRIETLDTLDDVRYARRLEDGTLIAGLPQGRYALRRPGQRWSYLGLPDRDPVIAYVDTTPDGGAVFVASTPAKTMVFKRASLDAPDAEVQTIATLDFPLHLRPNPVLSLDNGLLIVENHPGISRTAHLTMIDKQSLKVRTTQLPFWINSWQRMPSGEIVVSRQNGMSHYKSVSNDQGATWSGEPAEIPRDTRYIDAQRGYGLNMTPGLFDVTIQLLKTVDGGKTWTKAGPSLDSKGTTRLLRVADGAVFAAIGAEMYVSRDDGKTWTRSVLRENAPPKPEVLEAKPE